MGESRGMRWDGDGIDDEAWRVDGGRRVILAKIL
jgi:hypothetical protein